MTSDQHHLMAITDRHLMSDTALELLRRTAANLGHRFWVMVREKDLDGQALYEFAKAIESCLHGTQAKLLINQRLDVAISLGPKVGVHLPETGLPTAVVRDLVGPHRTIGRSIHDSQGAKLAVDDGVDLLTIAPVFEVAGKGPAIGIQGLKKIRRLIPASTLLFGLGGLDQANCRSIQSHVDGFAAIRAFWTNNLGPDRDFLLDQSPPGPT